MYNVFESPVIASILRLASEIFSAIVYVYDVGNIHLEVSGTLSYGDS
jgi:hypothetical protein